MLARPRRLAPLEGNRALVTPFLSADTPIAIFPHVDVKADSDIETEPGAITQARARVDGAQP